VEGDDFNEPIADAVRAILDGHVVLSRQLSAAGHYPAIDILNSVSRLSSQISSSEQKSACEKLRDAIATYRNAEDLINLGAYTNGSNPKIDTAIAVRPRIDEFTKQDSHQRVALDETFRSLRDVAGLIK
jgi:flagellar biosynthesis/type III secretory pathway ATPase